VSASLLREGRGTHSHDDRVRTQWDAVGRTRVGQQVPEGERTDGTVDPEIVVHQTATYGAQRRGRAAQRTHPVLRAVDVPRERARADKHVHNVDEWFYVLDGTVDFELEGETSSGQDGDSLWIPRGTVHSFNVTSDVCHVLNGYTPGGFEQVIKGLARPAPKRELPPRTEEPSPEDVAAAQFLFSNYWTARAEDPWAKSFAR